MFYMFIKNLFQKEKLVLHIFIKNLKFKKTQKQNIFVGFLDGFFGVFLSGFFGVGFFGWVFIANPASSPSSSSSSSGLPLPPSRSKGEFSTILHKQRVFTLIKSKQNFPHTYVS
jgi:hypothetical protein